MFELSNLSARSPCKPFDLLMFPVYTTPNSEDWLTLTREFGEGTPPLNQKESIKTSCPSCDNRQEPVLLPQALLSASHPHLSSLSRDGSPPLLISSDSIESLSFPSSRTTKQHCWPGESHLQNETAHFDSFRDNFYAATSASPHSCYHRHTHLINTASVRHSPTLHCDPAYFQQHEQQPVSYSEDSQTGSGSNQACQTLTIDQSYQDKETALFDFNPDFTFPETKPVRVSAATVNMQFRQSSHEWSRLCSMPRQRPEIPSISQLVAPPSPSNAWSVPAAEPSYSTNTQNYNHYVHQLKEFQANRNSVQSVPSQQIGSFSAAMSLEPSVNKLHEEWLAVPSAHTLGPVNGNRRRSASTGALPSTYCTIPYGIPAEASLYPQAPSEAPQQVDPATAADQTISLWDLQDPAEGLEARPHYPLATLIRYAILGSEIGRLTLQEIYEAIEERYEFFRTAGKGWKNSVSYNRPLLSASSLFLRFDSGAPQPFSEQVL